nr:hypothetical protein [Blastococcus colisei]
MQHRVLDQPPTQRGPAGAVARGAGEQFLCRAGTDERRRRQQGHPVVADLEQGVGFRVGS